MRPHGAGLVTGAGRFDLHHVGAEVAEQLGAERAGDAFGDVEDAHLRCVRPGKG